MTSITVSIREGRERRIIRANHADSSPGLFLWTRKDGGITVRSGGVTHRFSKYVRPVIVGVTF